MNVVAFDDDIAQVDTDAKMHRFTGRNTAVLVGQVALNLNCPGNRANSRRKFQQKGIAHGFDDTPAVRCSRRFN
jgi:hypothetical protein